MTPEEVHRFYREIAQDVKRLNTYLDEQDRRLGVSYQVQAFIPRNPQREITQ